MHIHTFSSGHFVSELCEYVSQFGRGDNSLAGPVVCLERIDNILLTLLQARVLVQYAHKRRKVDPPL